MKHLRFSLLILLLASFSAAVLAQKPKKKQDDVQVIKFDNDDETEPEPISTNGIIIKTSPISYVFGHQMVEVEFEMSRTMSVQFGLGATFSPVSKDIRVALEELREEDYCNSDLWLDDVCDNYKESIYRKPKTGVLLSASMRFFFEDDGFEGGYFAPVFRYSTIRASASTATGNSGAWGYSSTETQAEKVTNFDFIGHLGYQKIYPKMTTEFFLGLGLRFRNNLRQDLGFDQWGIIQNGVRKFKDDRLRLELGFRLGFQL